MYVVNVMQEQILQNEDSRIGLKIPVTKTTSNGYDYLRIQFKMDEKYDCAELYLLTPSEHEQIMEQIKADNYIDKHKTIEDLKNTIKSHEQTIADLKEMNDSIAKEKDNLQKQLDNSIDASELEDLQKQVATLSDELRTSKECVDYWKQSYHNLIDSSDALANENENYKIQNEKLRNDNNSINETNKLLNENIIGLKTTFEQTLEDNTTKAKNTEIELKETIKNMQSHIDEITDKYQSLLVLKEHIPQNQHYSELDALKDELHKVKLELEQKDSELETKLATQKSELEVAHTNEKAQLLVAYNKNLDRLKIKYNTLANEYNHLLSDAHSLTLMNTIFDSKHKKIVKDKEPIPLLDIEDKQEIIEMVQKDEVTIA